MKEYLRKFRKFHYESTDKDWFKNLEEEIYKSFEKKTVLPYHQHKAKIMGKWQNVYSDFLKYSKNVSPDEAVTWYHTVCLQDFDLFCLNYVRPDNGLPMFPLEWQSECSRMVDEHEAVFGLMSRKLGKTAFFQAETPFRMVNYPPEHVRIFAPTDKQLFVMRDIYQNLQRSEFLMEEFVMDDTQDRNLRGKFTADEIIFGRNWSTVSATNLSQTATKGKAKVGEKGTFFLVDEWGLVLNEVMGTVIIPMMADAHSTKKILGFGTPTLDVNPDMNVIWDEYKADSDIYTISHDWIYGVTNGCIPTKYMKKYVFDWYRIPCPFGRNYGVCVAKRFGKEIRINEKTNKLCYPGEEGYETSWSCDECCMLNKSFVEEYTAGFSRRFNRYWPMERVRGLANENMEFEIRPNQNSWYYSTVDFGLLMYPTQAMIWEKIQNKLYLRAYKEIPPMTETKEKGNTEPTYKPVIKKLHEFFDPFEERTKKYYFDITGKESLSYDLVNGFSFNGEWIAPFKRAKIFQNDSAKDNNTWGIWNSGPFNYYMKENLRGQLLAGNLEYPKRNPFYENFVWEFEHCIVQSTANEQYLKFDHPKNGRRRIDILDATSQVALCLDKNQSGSSPVAVVGVSRGKVYVAK